MESAIKETETNLNIIDMHIDDIDIFNIHNESFEDKSRNIEDSLLDMKKESLFALHRGDSDLPESEELSPITHHINSSVSSTSPHRDPLRNIHNIPNNLVKKYRSANTEGIFKKPSGTFQSSGSSAKRYSLANSEVKIDRIMEIRGFDFTDDDLVELGDEDQRGLSPFKIIKLKKTEESTLEPRQKDLIHSLVGVNSTNIKQIIWAVANTK